MDTKPPEIHKFRADSGMTYEEVYELAFKTNLIPLLQGLAVDLEDDDFIERLKSASSRMAAQGAQEGSPWGPISPIAVAITESDRLRTILFLGQFPRETHDQRIPGLQRLFPKIVRRKSLQASESRPIPLPSWPCK